MGLKIALLDDGSEDFKDKLSDLRHSDTFDIAGVVCPTPPAGLRIPWLKSLDELLALRPDVLSIRVADERILSTFARACSQCKNIIISGLAPLPLDSLKSLGELAKEHNVRAVLDLASRFNPVVFSLEKDLAKEDEIYSIYTCCTAPDVGSIVELLVRNIDLASLVCASPLEGVRDLSCTILAHHGRYNQASLKLIMQPAIALGLHASLLGDVSRHFIEVCTSGGIYHADLLGRKLFKQTPIGQINLKVDSNASETRTQYKELHEFFLCPQAQQRRLASIEDIIKIKELFA